MILGIIPARGGSKGIPRKNMKVISGKPLIAWTIDHAKSSKLLDHFLVSTEDEQIGRFAKNNGVEWWKRDPALATDEASTISVLKEVVLGYPKKITSVVVLQPTSAIRGENLIDTCIKLFLEKKLDSLATGFIDKNAEYGKFQHYRRQDFKGRFCDDGNIYVIKAKSLKNNDRIGSKFGGMVISREENLEVDDAFDVKIVEHLLTVPFNGEQAKGLKRGTRHDFVDLSNQQKLNI